MLSLPSQATRAQRLSGSHSRTRVVLWRRAFLYVPQIVLRKMRGASRTVESMPLLGRTRPRSPQQGVLRLQEHRMCRVPINRPHHRKLPTDQSLSSSVPRTHRREIHHLRPETSNRRVPRLRTTSSIRGGQQAAMLFFQQPEMLLTSIYSQTRLLQSVSEVFTKVAGSRLHGPLSYRICHNPQLSQNFTPSW